MSRSARLRLLRFVAQVFIWVGAVACVVYLALAMSSISSLTGFLLTIADATGRLSATVGVGAVLLALAEIAAGIGSQKQHPNNEGE